MFLLYIGVRNAATLARLFQVVNNKKIHGHYEKTCSRHCLRSDARPDDLNLQHLVWSCGGGCGVRSAQAREPHGAVARPQTGPTSRWTRRPRWPSSIAIHSRPALQRTAWRAPVPSPRGKSPTPAAKGRPARIARTGHMVRPARRWVGVRVDDTGGGEVQPRGLPSERV
eukprot:scaffold8422_cov115-Isochrysis_galbana.AAC.3